MLADIVRRYQSFNPDSGEFDRPRGVREYARLLGINHGYLSQILNGIESPGLTVIIALARAFPQSPAADEIAEALKQPAEPVAVPS